MENPKIQDIIGLKVHSIKSFCKDKRKKKNFEPHIILFTDKKTFIELEDQDYYSYHDCDSSAKVLRIFREKQLWNRYNTDPSYRDADIPIE